MQWLDPKSGNTEAWLLFARGRLQRHGVMVCGYRAAVAPGQQMNNVFQLWASSISYIFILHRTSPGQNNEAISPHFSLSAISGSSSHESFPVRRPCSASRALGSSLHLMGSGFMCDSWEFLQFKWSKKQPQKLMSGGKFPVLCRLSDGLSKAASVFTSVSQCLLICIALIFLSQSFLFSDQNSLLFQFS